MMQSWSAWACPGWSAPCLQASILSRMIFPPNAGTARLRRGQILCGEIQGEIQALLGEMPWEAKILHGEMLWEAKILRGEMPWEAKILRGEMLWEAKILRGEMLRKKPRAEKRLRLWTSGFQSGTGAHRKC